MTESITLSIEKFSPPVAELRKAVSETELVKLDDLDDAIQLKAVKESRLTLKGYRVKIAKYGKELRGDALKFQKQVIVKEKELLGIIEPEEIRLTELEDKATEHLDRKKRVALIPQRREILLGSDPDYVVTDEELISLDGPEFEELRNKIAAEKIEHDREVLRLEQERIDEEKAKIAYDKEIKDAADKAREEEREKAERERKRHAEETRHRETEEKNRRETEARESKERIAQEEQEAKDRIAAQEREAKEKLEREEQERKEKLEAERKEKEEVEQKKREEKVKLEKEERYQIWLKSSGYDAENCILKEERDTVILYRRVSTFNRNENN